VPFPASACRRIGQRPQTPRPSSAGLSDRARGLFSDGFPDRPLGPQDVRWKA